MRKILFYIFLIGFLPFMAVSCDLDAKDSTNTVYNEALVTAMTFMANDSFPGLKEAKFTIITSTDTGKIYNVDSLRYGTRIDSVIPSLSFNHTPAYTIFYTGVDSTADTIVYTGADTINFTVQPTKLVVMASDKETAKVYEIYVNVHSVDPDLYEWECLTDAVYQADGGENKAVLLNDCLMLYVNNGFQTQLYHSINGSAWSAGEVVSSLPANCNVRKILEAEGTLYYPDGNQLYTSTDGRNWTSHSVSGFRILNMLYLFNDSIWGIAERSDNQLQFCNMAKNGQMQLTGDILPENFPVSDYAALPFASASNRKRAMIVGGFDRHGNTLNTRWNVEYLKGKGYSMTNFSVEQPSFASLTGAAIVRYNNEFHMFGSVSDNNQISDYNQLISTDEGLNWYEPDTAKNSLPASYQNRQKASVFVDEKTHYIYIIGGQNRTQSFADVYRGRLNKLTFKDYNE